VLAASTARRRSAAWVGGRQTGKPGADASECSAVESQSNHNMLTTRGRLSSDKYRGGHKRIIEPQAGPGQADSDLPMQHNNETDSKVGKELGRLTLAGTGEQERQ
jgi:hypothetical protein